MLHGCLPELRPSTALSGAARLVLTATLVVH